MGRLTDLQIRSWINAEEHFDARSDGDGLSLRFRGVDAVPRWLLRYRIAGKPRVLHLGTYTDLSLAEARKLAKSMRARITLGHDVASEKKLRKAEVVAKLLADKMATVSALADEYFEKRVLGHWKHPDIFRRRMERDVKPEIGNFALAEVRPIHISNLLEKVVGRGAPTIANDVLRWLKRMFNYALKLELVKHNPVYGFDLADAGGVEQGRRRWLDREEISQIYAAMRIASGWSLQNTLTVKLILMLGVRKCELIAALTEEFDLENAVWNLPGERTKSGIALDIPLPRQAVIMVRDLMRIAGSNEWLLPARKSQTRMLPHISESTLNAAIKQYVQPYLRKVEHFTIHDFRRTARTHLEALGVMPRVAERCLNHTIKGVEGVYNRHDYFDERRDALQRWADLLEELNAKPVVLIDHRRHSTDIRLEGVSAKRGRLSTKKAKIRHLSASPDPLVTFVDSE